MRPLIMIFILSFIGCGGGTSGTSSTGIYVEKKIEGTIKDENKIPLSNAEVKIVATGQKVMTDRNGALSVLAKVPVGPNELIVTSEQGKKYLIYPIVAEDEETVILRLIFPQVARDIYRDWELTAEVSGEGCEESFFDGAGFSSEDVKISQSELDRQAEAQGYTGASLQQSSYPRNGTVCTLKITILKDKQPKANMAYSGVIQFCEGKAQTEYLTEPDVSVTTDLSGLSNSAGVIEIPIAFTKKPLCRFEVIIPAYGGLPLGAISGITSKYLVDNF